MYLKSIEINGFKSFAKKTLLTFDGQVGDRFSITSIVGPNGSGKSNVSDAIRWVMGEQKMTKLRAKKSGDIIFAGSAAKGQMGMASVSLTIDNSEGDNEIEFDELVITRRLYRDGESEYLINGKAVRLIDLQILLAKAQFGQGSYSVVGQGMIDTMLLQSPAERKSFFDEASGIKEFQIKRHQASLKLLRTEEHIEQAEMLLAEVEPRMKSLSRQVKKLEERQDVELALRELQEQYYTTLHSYHQSNIDGLRAEISEATGALETGEAHLRTVQEEIATLAKGASRQEAFDALQRAYQEIVQKKNTLEREKAVLSGKMQTEYSKAGKQNVGWLEQKIEELTAQHKQIVQEKKDAEEKMARIRADISADTKAAEHAAVEKTTLRNRIASMQQALMQKQGERQYQQFTGIRAVQAILEDRHQFGSVHGAVAQLGSVEQKFQLAMDVAAGSHLSSLVVGDDEVAQRCINYLRHNQLGYATFLPLNKIQGRFIAHDIAQLSMERGVYGLAVDLISFEKRFEDIFSYIFANTLIVDSIDVARRLGIGKVRMVTLDGDVIDRSGSMKGGYRKKDRSGMSFSEKGGAAFAQDSAQLEAEVAQLERELAAREEAHNELSQALRESETAIRVAEGEMRLLEQRLGQIETERGGLEQELSLHTMSEGEYDLAMKEIALKRDGLDSDMSSIDAELEAAQKKIDAFHEEEEEKKRRVFALQEEMQEQQLALNTIIQEKNAKHIELAKYETKQEDLEHEVFQEMKSSLGSIIARGAQPLDGDKLEEAQVEIQKLKYKLSLIGGIDEAVIAEFAETKERFDGLTDQLDDLRKAMKDLRVLIEELDAIMKKRRAKAFKEIKKEFQKYFSILFEGGKADLVEVYDYEDSKKKDQQINEEDDESESEETEEDEMTKKRRGKKVLVGIDIMANPPGKKIKHLQTLSGGERTMTSIALVCAILRVNPSPFVVLDEVEAALDEANSLRLTNIIKELAEQSQFILITHNRATMHASDALYGVTMGNDGMSSLLSVKLGEAQEMVAE